MRQSVGVRSHRRRPAVRARGSPSPGPAQLRCRSTFCRSKPVTTVPNPGSVMPSFVLRRAESAALRDTVHPFSDPRPILRKCIVVRAQPLAGKCALVRASQDTSRLRLPVTRVVPGERFAQTPQPPLPPRFAEIGSSSDPRARLTSRRASCPRRCGPRESAPGAGSRSAWPEPARSRRPRPFCGPGTRTRASRPLRNARRPRPPHR